MGTSKQTKTEARQDISYGNLRSVFDGPSYSEKVVEVRKAYNDLATSDKSRTNRQNRKRSIELLSRLIERTPDDVRTLLSHSEMLNEEALQLIAREKLSRNFFIQTQRTKNRLVRELVAAGSLSESDIMEVVLTAQKTFIGEYRGTGKVTKTYSLNQNTDAPVRKLRSLKPETFKYKPPELFDINSKISQPQIRQNMRAVQKILDDHSGSKNLLTKKAISDLRRIIEKLCEIKINCDELQRQGCNNKRKGGSKDAKADRISRRSGS